MARIAILTVSDRAARGEYEDRGGPAAEDWLRRAITTPIADLILATGGTGPSPRDQTPEAMADVIAFDLPGFGEAMRAANGKVVATAILSRQGAGVRGRTLIITLPGSPNAISTSLEAVFAAVPYCLDLIGAARIDTDPNIIKAHRPKGA